MFFSIIIPTYNRANLLPETIGSVQNQTFEDWECIVVDDGSTDNTKQVVQEIINSDSRIKYVFQENAERSAARNNGIRNSSGEYICFLDSDDNFFADHLEKLSEFIVLQKEPICMVINQSLNVSDEEEYVTNLNQPSFNPIEFLYLNPVSPSRVCVHKLILNELQFDEEIVIVEDVILWMKIADNYPFYVSDHTGVKYKIHDGNSVNMKNYGIVKKYYGVIIGKKKYPELFNRIPRNSYNYWTSRIITNVAFHHILNHNRFQALKWLLKAIIMKPIHIHTKMRIYLIYKLIFFKNIEI